MRNQVLGLTSDLQFYFYQTPIKMNLGIQGLVGIIINELNRDPRNGDVYIFVSRSRKVIKLLHYKDYSFTLYIRKIYHGCFAYPYHNKETDAYYMDWPRFRRLLNGYGIIEK